MFDVIFLCFTGNFKCASYTFRSHSDDEFVSCVFDLMARRSVKLETWLISNQIEASESNIHVYFLFADTMKRENEDNYQDQDQQQQQQSNEMAPEEEIDQENSQDGTNDTNEFNNENNQDNGGGPNPPKRQRRNDDEEIRLLIPSKVHIFNFRIFIPNPI